jgi:hypothetical protein
VSAELARRIEDWLLESDIQMAGGGVAGWLDGAGRAEFVYLEITGYYLTAMAWLAAGAASDASRARRALARGRDALGWLRSVTVGGTLPPTRLYLDGDPGDWRNSSVFTFDLAMAARGAASFGAVAGAEAGPVVASLVGRLDGLCGERAPLRSHEQVGPDAPPNRWSTRPGVYHLKAAAALLRLPAGIVGERLAGVCRGTVAHWADRIRTTAVDEGLHPLLYGVEGLLVMDTAPDVVEGVFGRALPVIREEARSDVVAQALRVGAFLRRSGRLHSELGELRDLLAGYVRPDGGVAFAAGQDRANAWCAMFAHQALVFAARPEDAVAEFLV